MSIDQSCTYYHIVSTAEELQAPQLRRVTQPRNAFRIIPEPAAAGPDDELSKLLLKRRKINNENDA